MTQGPTSSIHTTPHMRVQYAAQLSGSVAQSTRGERGGLRVCEILTLHLSVHCWPDPLHAQPSSGCLSWPRAHWRYLCPPYRCRDERKPSSWPSSTRTHATLPRARTRAVPAAPAAEAVQSTSTRAPAWPTSACADHTLAVRVQPPMLTRAGTWQTPSPCSPGLVPPARASYHASLSTSGQLSLVTGPRMSVIACT